MYLFLESGMRGGVSMIAHRHAVANNGKGADPSLPPSFLIYIDANNLYGWAMSQPLPIRNFRWLNDNEVAKFTSQFVMSLDDKSSKNPNLSPSDNASDDERSDIDTGYVAEVDLVYPEELHDLHNSLPLAPERLLVTKDMLSPYAESFSHPAGKVEKLVPNLYNKTKYVTHYKNLKFYIEHGMILTKVHRVLAFDQEPWMKSYIDKNTESRKLAKDDFEKDLYKLLNNAVFGKTMENMRARVDVKLVTNEHRLKKLVARPTYQFHEIINEELVMVNMGRKTLCLNKPIYAGFSILEISKTLMFEFHYDTVLKRYGDRARLLFTDTDSLCYHIQTDDIYNDMLGDLDAYDTSNYPKGHRLYSTINGKVLGKFKDETASKPPIEFIGLKSKMYSLLVEHDKPSKLTAKGVKRSWVDAKLRHDNFRYVLENRTETYADFFKFTSSRQSLHTELIHKKCLDAFDDKRYLLDDGITSLSYGHKDIPPSRRRRLATPVAL
jgi:hypothetical protein